MKNDLLEAKARRDNSVGDFLTRQQAAYADIEEDVAQLRADLAANLTQVNARVQQVLTAGESGAVARSRGVRGQLTDLLLRQGRSLKAVAVSTRNADLLAKLPTRPSALTKLRETGFAEEARRLLDLGAPLAKELEKRRFGPALTAEAESLLATYNATVVGKRADVTDGSTGRLAVERLLKDNSRIVAALRTFFELYKDDATEGDVYDQFRAVSKVVRRGGHDGPLPGADATPQQ